MSTETITIPLTNGNLNGSDFVYNEDDTQYVTLTDGGNISFVQLGHFGKGTPTQIGEGPGGNDEFHIDLSNFDDDFTLTSNSLDSGDTFFVSGGLSWSQTGNVYTIRYIGSDDKEHDFDIDVESTNNTGIAKITIACFAQGMMIETDNGRVPVESLEIGDMVLCGDAEYHPLRWVSQRHIGQPEMAANGDFRPIRICRNALGNNMPDADLVVSPQHRVLLSDWRAELMFGAAEVLVAAAHLVNDRDIVRDHSCDHVTYCHFMFDDHQTVWSNGIETESFYPGATALRGVEPAARNELFALFPDLATAPETYGATCQPALKAHEAMAMLGR